MSSRNHLNVSLATWQWRDSLVRLFLISIMFAWGFLLEIFGRQPDYSPELQYLMSFGSFILAIIIGVLAQATLVHMFSYIQGYFLLKIHGIPLDAIMSGEQTPARVLSACLTILRHKQNGIEDYKKQKFYQISLYICTLIVYFASVGIGGYAASKLAMPFVYYSSPIKWVQVPTIPDDKVRAGINNAFLPNNFNYGITSIQYNSLANWVDNTSGSVTEVAFMPVTYTNQKKAADNGNLRDSDGLLKWKVELEFKNINMQYLTAQCNVDPNPPCDADQLQRESTMFIKVGRENKTITWVICYLPNETGSVQLDCTITLKQGTFLSITTILPKNKPRDEQLAEVLLRKNELNDLDELKDEMFSKMEEVITRPTYNSSNDLISSGVTKQLVRDWTCEAGNVTCAQRMGSSAAVQFFGARLETANELYPINVNHDWIGNSTSTGTLTASHKACIGGSNPMLSIGLMIAIPLIMVIIELLPILIDNKAWWLASDVGFKHIALLRSTVGSEINLPECTTRPNETTCDKTTVRFDVENIRLKEV